VNNPTARTRWSWHTHLLRVEFEECGHQFEDRPPRPSMTVDEIRSWVEHFYGACPRCPGVAVDRRALLADDAQGVAQQLNDTSS